MRPISPEIPYSSQLARMRYETMYQAWRKGALKLETLGGMVVWRARATRGYHMLMYRAPFETIAEAQAHVDVWESKAGLDGPKKRAQWASDRIKRLERERQHMIASLTHLSKMYRMYYERARDNGDLLRAKESALKSALAEVDARGRQIDSLTTDLAAANENVRALAQRYGGAKRQLDSLAESHADLVDDLIVIAEKATDAEKLAAFDALMAHLGGAEVNRPSHAERAVIRAELSKLRAAHDELIDDIIQAVDRTDRPSARLAAFMAIYNRGLE